MLDDLRIVFQCFGNEERVERQKGFNLHTDAAIPARGSLAEWRLGCKRLASYLQPWIYAR